MIGPPRVEANAMQNGFVHATPEDKAEAWGKRGESDDPHKIHRASVGWQGINIFITGDGWKPFLFNAH